MEADRQIIHEKAQVSSPDQLIVGQTYRAKSNSIDGKSNFNEGIGLRVTKVDIEAGTFEATLILDGKESVVPGNRYMDDYAIVAYNRNDSAFPGNQCWNERNYLVLSDLNTELKRSQEELDRRLKF